MPDWQQRLAVQKVNAISPGKNRIHLDLVTDAVTTAIARWQELGAELVATHELGGVGWTVLADPQGNQFCVAPTE